MEILHHFDSGVVQPFEISGDRITFDLRPGQRILNVLIRNAPERLAMDLLVDENGEKFLLNQGLLVSEDGETFRSVPVEKPQEGMLRASVSVPGGQVRLATRYPYGRDALDRLLCDTHRVPYANVRLFGRGHRRVPIFDFGEDGEGKPHHIFIAGEDTWETAGCWVADGLVRTLCSDRPFADALLERGVIHVAPLASPYSATMPSASYTTLEGKGIYGAATWGDEAPPPEYALLREEVVRIIREKRLGLMLTIHSWQGSHEVSEVGTIRRAGENTLTESRSEWATATMETLMRNVPQSQHRISERIWHSGLARDYLLDKHNAITFRIEVTTAGLGPDGFRLTAQRMLDNLGRITDWAPACASA